MDPETVQGESKSGTQKNSMGNKQIMEAVEIMDKARAWLGTDLQMLPALTQKMLGDMEVTLVMYVQGFLKRAKSRNNDKKLK